MVSAFGVIVIVIVIVIVMILCVWRVFRKKERSDATSELGQPLLEQSMPMVPPPSLTLPTSVAKDCSASLTRI